MDLQELGFEIDLEKLSAIESMQYLERFQKIIGNTQELTPDKEDCTTEKLVTCDPNRRIIASFVLTPPLQAVRKEFLKLWEEFQSLKKADPGYQAHTAKMELMTTITHDFISSELAKIREVCDLLVEDEDMECVFGANWRVLVVTQQQTEKDHTTH